MLPEVSILGRLPAGWAEPATLLVMLAVFGVLSAGRRWQPGIALGVAALTLGGRHPLLTQAKPLASFWILTPKMAARSSSRLTRSTVRSAFATIAVFSWVV